MECQGGGKTESSEKNGTMNNNPNVREQSRGIRAGEKFLNDAEVFNNRRGC